MSKYEPSNSKNINSRINYYFTMEKAKLSLELERNVSFTELYNILSKEVGIQPNTLQRLKSGALYTPSLEVALKLAQYFNVSVEDIFSLNIE